LSVLTVLSWFRGVETLSHIDRTNFIYEEGGSTVFRNIGIQPPHYTEHGPRKPQMLIPCSPVLLEKLIVTQRVSLVLNLRV